MVEGELRAPEPGEPGDPGEPGFKEVDEGGLDKLLLVEPEKASLKLGFCLPDKLDFPSTSLTSGSFTGDTQEMVNTFFPYNLCANKIFCNHDVAVKRMRFNTYISFSP